MIEKGKKVTMNYTVKILNDSEIFESTQGSEPVTFTYGEDRLIEGLEESLLHKNVGDKFTAEIEMKMAYGPIREELFVKLHVHLMKSLKMVFVKINVTELDTKII